MTIQFFVRGLITGLSVAAVVGPIALLCMQRTVRHGFRYGFITGLGAATADALYGSVAAFGLTVITTFLVAQYRWIHLLGGLFLVYLGGRILLKKPAEKAAQIQANSFLEAYLSTLLLTLTNPQTILSFAAIFAGLGMTGNGQEQNSIVVVGGVFLGSTLWWFLLSGGVNILRGYITTRWFVWITRLSGCVILCFGVYTLLSLSAS